MQSSREGPGGIPSSPGLLGGRHCSKLSVSPLRPPPAIFSTASGTTHGPDQQGPPEHVVMAARMECLSRQNQLNGAHSPHACVCVCTCVGSHAARKEKGRAHKLWSVPTALPRPQPRGAHTGPGALLAQTHAHATRCPTAHSGLLLHRQRRPVWVPWSGSQHSCTYRPLICQQNACPREAQLAERGR